MNNITSKTANMRQLLNRSRISFLSTFVSGEDPVWCHLHPEYTLCTQAIHQRTSAQHLMINKRLLGSQVQALFEVIPRRPVSQIAVGGHSAEVRNDLQLRFTQCAPMYHHPRAGWVPSVRGTR